MHMRNCLRFSTFPINCQTVTYSLWLKFSKEEATEKRKRSIIRSQSFSYKYIHFSKIGADFSFDITASGTKKWYIPNFGANIDQSLWNHFAFTLDDSKKACAYINGKQQACDHIPWTVSIGGRYNEVKIGGGYESTDMATMSVDEMAIWKKTLTPEEIKLVYDESKVQDYF